ncbi:MAG: HDIG domain-containing metalloprotein [Patescibacteria group bacterium]
MSIFQSFTNAFQKKNTPKKTVTQSTPATPKPKVSDAETKLLIQAAENRAIEILIEAKEDAIEIEKITQDELAQLRQQYTELTSELEKRDKGVQIQESIVSKKEQNAKKLTDLITNTQQHIEETKQDLLVELAKKGKLEQDEAEQILKETLQNEIEIEAQKELKSKEDFVTEHAELIAQQVLVQVMKHGSSNYHSEYTPPIISFESAQDESRILGRDQENIHFIEEVTGVEITFDEEMHQLKLYCFNTIKREIARVLIERLRKGGIVTQAKIQQLFQQSKADLERDMFAAGTYLCHQLNIFNLPREIIQTLGMFKYRYSYGQNMIIHTLEEAKIGIALAHELGVDTDVVRLGCLFHDIGKVIYDDENNHVESGVRLLEKFKMPKAVIACVAESHEDIPFSSIESMIVHVADSISGARPGARFDDYEGFLKHQQGLIDISMSQKGVTEAFVINGGREIRISVNPQQVKDQDLDALATTIRDQVQEFSTYPGSIVVNVGREFQHSELKD